ncbi:MAG: hypothetical protein HRT51_00410 [Colwellia sp.]|nr:hypothetical protein [Colwellia sp.]
MFPEFPQLKKRYCRQHFWARNYVYVAAGELT